jgi:hypothetical protein
MVFITFDIHKSNRRYTLFVVLDGDLITIFDSSDLAFAVQYSRILKLQILLGGEDKAIQRNQTLQPVQVNHIRRELQHIRDQVNHLLDSIEPRAVEVSSSTAENRSEYKDLFLETGIQ